MWARCLFVRLLFIHIFTYFLIFREVPITNSSFALCSCHLNIQDFAKGMWHISSVLGIIHISLILIVRCTSLPELCMSLEYLPMETIEMRLILVTNCIVYTWLLIPQIPNKLKYYGTPMCWFMSYLSNRTQYVKMNNVISSRSTISTGVPQVSIRTSTIFDLYELHRIFHCILYADDTTIFSIIGYSIPLQNSNVNGQLNQQLLEV